MSEHSRSFTDFAKELGNKVELAESMGMGSQDIKQKARQIGDWLLQSKEPQNAEQELLADLWKNASENERDALSSVLTKFAENHRDA